MDLVTGAMAILAPKLLQLLQDEYKLQMGVKKQVQSLSVDLENIHAFLRKVADVPWDRIDDQVKLWAREVREASYDMEDVLDTFLVCVEGCDDPANTSRLKRALNNMRSLFSKSQARRDIAGAIESIKEQLNEVAERHGKYRVEEIVAKPVTTTSAIDPRLAAMYKDVTQLCGIHKPTSDIISMLTSFQGDDVPSKKIMKMVSVVGVGGLGKTTLARSAYDNLKQEYDCGAFISVGQNPDLLKVFKDILFDLDKNKYENIHNTARGVDLLIREIREFLENKRYLIVIDDIWDLRSMETIKLALFENYCRSGIITTTRNIEIATEAGEVYKLKELAYDDSKKLFCTRIFGEDGKCLPSQQGLLLDKFIKKCGGLPLAIITMASLLVGKSLQEWSEVYNSIGFGNKDNLQVENTMRILSFSYYDLPSHLRTCLLYLCAFPEDSVIDKDLLIWKWIAEGFVHEKQGKGLFDIGESYFDDLINRSMIQVKVKRWDGVVISCHVHDMVLDLIRTLSSEENFVHILDTFGGTLSNDSKVHRLACQNITSKNIITTQSDHMEMRQVRSYLAFRCDNSLPILLSRFKLLRVLAIENCRFIKHCNLEHLGTLLHLRYLGLRGTNINELPRQIGELKFLQTLDAMHTGIKHLPPSILLLAKLVCLRSDSWDLDGIGKLMSLEDLRIHYCSSDRSSVQSFVKEIGSLRELRVLELTIGMTDEATQRHFVESLSNLQKIRHLHLSGDATDADTDMWEATGFELPRHTRHLSLSSIHFSRLPSSCINPSCLGSLSNLSLRLAAMGADDLKLMGRLPELQCLQLSTESTLIVTDFDACDGFFLKLRWFWMAYSMLKFFQHNLDEDEPSVSLHIWNGSDAMPFVSTTAAINHGFSGSCAVMPKLEILTVGIFVRASKDGNGDCGSIGVGCLPSLRKLCVSIDCGRASAAEVDEAVAALKRTADGHPNHLAFEVHKRNGGDQVVSSVQDPEGPGQIAFYQDC